MSLPKELLDVAIHLSHRERLKPKQASLRRAISTGYYALFHLFTEEAARAFLRGNNTKIFDKTFRRIFEHTEMKNAAKSFKSGTLPDFLAIPLGSKTVSSDLRQVADTFFQAQEKRHTADYDLTQYFSKRETKKMIDDIKRAFAIWQRIKTTPEAVAFLFALFTTKRLETRK